MDHKRAFWMNFIIVVALIAGVTFYQIFGGGSSASFTLEADHLSFCGPDPAEFTVTVLFEDIASIEFREELDQGSCVSGEAGKTYTYGIWENEEFGRYSLYRLTKVESCIVLTETDGDIIVFNIENAKTTEEFSKSLSEYLQELKQPTS